MQPDERACSDMLMTAVVLKEAAFKAVSEAYRNSDARLQTENEARTVSFLDVETYGAGGETPSVALVGALAKIARLSGVMRFIRQPSGKPLFGPSLWRWERATCEKIELPRIENDEEKLSAVADGGTAIWIPFLYDAGDQLHGKSVCGTVSMELGMSRSAYSFSFLVSSAVMVAVSLFYGRIYKRLGVQKIILLTGVSALAACIVSALAQGAAATYAGALLRGLALALGSTAIVANVVYNWFNKYQGLVMGAVFSAVGFGGAAMMSIYTHGWQAPPSAGGEPICISV